MFIRLTNRTREQTIAALELAGLYESVVGRLNDRALPADQRAPLQLAGKAAYELAGPAQAAGLRPNQLARLVDEHPVVRPLLRQTLTTDAGAGARSASGTDAGAAVAGVSGSAIGTPSA